MAWSKAHRERARKANLARQSDHDKMVRPYASQARAAGMTAAAFADMLEDAGVPTPGGLKNWSPTAAWRIMKRLYPRCANTPDMFGG